MYWFCKIIDSWNLRSEWEIRSNIESDKIFKFHLKGASVSKIYYGDNVICTYDGKKTSFLKRQFGQEVLFLDQDKLILKILRIPGFLNIFTDNYWCSVCGNSSPIKVNKINYNPRVYDFDGVKISYYDNSDVEFSFFLEDSNNDKLLEVVCLSTFIYSGFYNSG